MVGTTLGENDCVPLRFGSVLHQEIHALVYCSETVRQIDFTNCFPEPILRQDVSASQSGLGLLAPVLNMLDSGLTKCNNIILSGNMLRSADIDALREYFHLSLLRKEYFAHKSPTQSRQ